MESPPKPSFCNVCEYTYETDGAATRGWTFITWGLMAIAGLSNALFFSDDLLLQIVILFIPLGLVGSFHVSVSCMACRGRRKQTPYSLVDDDMASRFRKDEEKSREVGAVVAVEQTA